MIDQIDFAGDRPRGRGPQTATPVWRWIAGAASLFAALTLLGTVGADTGGATPRAAAARKSIRASAAACAGSPVSVVSAGQKSDEEVVIDGSVSTASPVLREQYRQVALSVVQRAAGNGSAVRIVVFGASGVGARVVFSGSFAPVSTVLAFNLAASNRLRCLARQGLASTLTTSSISTGTDVAGAVASALAWGRSVVKPGGLLSLTVLSDGCQSPSRSGANSRLTDLCGQLARGAPPGRILARHLGEFSLGDAKGVSVAMLGVGVGRFAQDASSERAKALIAFWELVCDRAHTASCLVGSAVL